MSEEARDVVKKEGGQVATLDFVKDSGMGLENIDKEDLALPFLKLLQSGSYETKKKHAKYVEGAEPGMFYNTVTKKLYDGEKGIEVIPVYYKMTYLNGHLLKKQKADLCIMIEGLRSCLKQHRMIETRTC